MGDELADQLSPGAAPRRGLGRGLGAILPARSAQPLSLLPHVAGHHLGSRGGVDPLTGLANRAELIEQLDDALRRAEVEGATLAVVVLGLDGFRHVNSAYGHGVGDSLLRQFGRRLARSRRGTDVVGRLGGDEFGVVCPRVGSPEAAGRMSARLSREMTAPLLEGGVEHRLTATVGIVLADPIRQPASSGRALLRRADLAMQRAKDAGEGCALFDSLVDAHQPPRWNTSAAVRPGLPAEAPGRSSRPG